MAEKFGCSSETLGLWVRRAERDQGLWPGLSSDQLAELGSYGREVREVRRPDEVLRKASAYQLCIRVCIRGRPGTWSPVVDMAA